MKKLSVLFFILSFLLLGCSTNESSNAEYKAKESIEEYLSALKVGKRDEAFKHLDEDVNGLIDVYKYEYLRLEDVQEKYDKTSIWSLSFYKDEEKYKDLYASKESLEDGIYLWNDLVTDIKKKYSNTDKYEVVEDINNLTFWDKTKPIEQYGFVYDMELVNKGGQKIYKKVKFTMERKSDAYLITKIEVL